MRLFVFKSLRRTCFHAYISRKKNFDKLIHQQNKMLNQKAPKFRLLLRNVSHPKKLKAVKNSDYSISRPLRKIKQFGHFKFWKIFFFKLDFKICSYIRKKNDLTEKSGLRNTMYFEIYEKIKKNKL
ncbi:hypothetical protein BpHYR1_009910 [Brachionus plicatilis]|uniref:Uncharacterized protein n=1 Tax=Brachionus plicatilis TaxID=10195 RepID=A0A3M7RF63_BRAPC|nr:hypothetical protein BpHYR1_009910 [Brachionus plicatilis]